MSVFGNGRLMKILTRLILSFLAVIALTATGLSVMTDWIVQDLTSQNLLHAEQALNSASEENYLMSQRVLTAGGEKIVELTSTGVAAILANKLAGRDISDYGKLREDNRLRRIATQNIQSPHGPAGHVDVYDLSGVAVFHPNQEVEGKNYSRWKDEFPEMWALVERSFSEPHVRGYYAFIDRDGEVKRKFLVTTHVDGTPFVVAAVVDIGKFFGPVYESIREAQNKATEHSRQRIARSVEWTLTLLQLAGVAGGSVVLVFAGGLGWWFARSISRPVWALNDNVKRLASGDFTAHVTETGPAEIRQLALSFNSLGLQLTEYVENLARTTAAKERMESELSIAAEIQDSLLPKDFTPWPDSDRLRIHALMKPARHVGGDLYYFVAIDEDRLFVAMGDVCGKGIPAAILMAVTKSLLDAGAAAGLTADEVLRRVNQRLSVNNDKCVFVTVFCGVIDARSGSLVYSNGGHDRPLVLRNSGNIDLLSFPSGPALGLFPDAEYPTASTTLQPGEVLFMYTDGVTEAMDVEGNLFSPGRLREILASQGSADAVSLVNGVLTAVESFARGAEQSDDITIMAVRLTERVADNSGEGQ